MASVFTKIIEGEIPARFVYKDKDVVAFLTSNPVAPGHILVVPRKEVDHWIDLEDDLLAKLVFVSKRLGQAIFRAFPCEKVSSQIVGLEVPHVHIHLYPINTMEDVDFRKADPSPAAQFQDSVQSKIISELG